MKGLTISTVFRFMFIKLSDVYSNPTIEVSFLTESLFFCNSNRFVWALREKDNAKLRMNEGIIFLIIL